MGCEGRCVKGGMPGMKGGGTSISSISDCRTPSLSGDSGSTLPPAVVCLKSGIGHDIGLQAPISPPMLMGHRVELCS